MAAKQLTIKELRRRHKISQEQLREKLDIPLSTYSLKERTGDFTEKELKVVASILKVSKEEINLRPKDGNINDNITYTVNAVIKIEATQRVILRAIAELWAKQSGREATSIYAGYTKEVRDETLAILDELKD